MKDLTKALGVLAIAVSPLAMASPAEAVVPVSMNNCNSSLSLPTPDAVACVGYFGGNILNGNADNVTAQVNAVAALGGFFNGNWSALANASGPFFVLDTDGSTPNPGLTNGNRLDFGQPLSGNVIIASHWGNVPDPTANPNNNGQTGNLTVFWRFNITTPINFITLDNTQGWSNAALYQNGPAVPEPATWAMMLVGFGAAGATMRRSRRKTQLAQLA